MLRATIVLFCINLLACTNSVQINLHSASTVNLSAQHQSLPVQIRVYQLSAQQKFNEASFRQLWKHDQEALGAQLINKTGVEVMPGKNKVIDLAVADATRFVGVVALFRKPGFEQFKVITKVNRNKFNKQRIKLYLEKNKLILE